MRHGQSGTRLKHVVNAKYMCPVLGPDHVGCKGTDETFRCLLFEDGTCRYQGGVGEKLEGFVALDVAERQPLQQQLPNGMEGSVVLVSPPEFGSRRH